MLTHRPDVLAAEHELIAANADIGAARAAFFPSITLTGNYGTASTQLSGLFKSGSEAWTFSPQISVPIFTGGANGRNLDLARWRRMSPSRSTRRRCRPRFARLTMRWRHAARSMSSWPRSARCWTISEAYRLADMRFRAGVDSFLPVLDAQRTLYSAQQAVVTVELERLRNLATLYKALGGGDEEDSVAH